MVTSYHPLIEMIFLIDRYAILVEMILYNKMHYFLYGTWLIQDSVVISKQTYLSQ